MIEIETRIPSSESKFLSGGGHFLERARDRLADFYFNPKPWERSGKLYELLGIKPYRKLLIEGEELFTRKFLASDYQKNHRPLDLGSYDTTTRVLEVAHIGTMTEVNIISLALLSSMGGIAPESLGILAIGSLVSHIYPIFLQRYTRARIHRVMERRNQLSTKNHSFTILEAA